jgi:hypothetical protein
VYTNSERGSVGHIGNKQRGEGVGSGEGQLAGSRGMSKSGTVSVRDGENIQGYPEDIGDTFLRNVG